MNPDFKRIYATFFLLEIELFYLVYLHTNDPNRGPHVYAWSNKGSPHDSALNKGKERKPEI